MSQNFTKTLGECGQIFKAKGVSFEQALTKSANWTVWPLVSLSFSSYTLLNTTAKFLLSSTFPTMQLGRSFNYTFSSLLLI